MTFIEDVTVSVTDAVEELQRLGMHSADAYWMVVTRRGLSEGDVVTKSLALSGNDLFFLLKFKSSQALTRFQDMAKEAFQDQKVKWTDPEEFHITLVFVHDLELEETVRLSENVEMEEPVDIQVDGFSVFRVEDGADSHTLFLNVARTIGLSKLQSRMYDLITKISDARLSKFSDPSRWSPHITIGTSEEPFDKSKLPEVGGVGVAGRVIVASVDFGVIDSSVEKFNPYHKPAGTPEGGQFDHAPGGSKFDGMDSSFRWQGTVAKFDGKGEPNQLQKAHRHAKNNGMTLDEYRTATTKHLREELEDAEVAIRIDPRTLSTVLDDGRFKNQHETGRSKGNLNPDLRREYEDRVFDGNKYDNDSERPIYGHLTSGGSESAASALNQYGRAKVILNEDVRDRTTFTIGDSLDTNAAGFFPTSSPRPVNRPSWKAASYGGTMDPLNMAVGDDSGLWYWETQTHGGISVSDINRVLFLPGANPSRAVLSKLDQANIPYEIVEE